MRTAAADPMPRWISLPQRPGRSWRAVALAVIVPVALALAGCAGLRPAHVPEPGQVLELQYKMNLVDAWAVERSPERIALPSASFLINGRVSDALRGDILADYPGGLEPPEGHDLVAVDLIRGGGIFNDPEAEPAQLEVLIDGAAVQIPAEGILPPPTSQGQPLYTQFLVVAPQESSAQLRFTDAGRTLVYDLRTNSVVPADSTARLDCAVGMSGYSATPQALETEGTVTGLYPSGAGHAVDTRPFSIDLGLGRSLTAAGGSWLYKTGYRPAEGWAPDGQCWLLISSNSVSTLSETVPPGVLNLDGALSFTPEGGTPTPVTTNTNTVGVFMTTMEDVGQFVVLVPADVHTGTLTFTPTVSFPDHRVSTPAPPVSSTLTF